MNFFQFRIRNPARDQQTDAARFNTLLTTLDALKAEIESEQTGLQRRYQKVAEMAALSLDAFENEGRESLSRKVDKLTTTMSVCKSRIAALEGHNAFLTEMRANVSSFADDLIQVSDKIRK